MKTQSFFAVLDENGFLVAQDNDLVEATSRAAHLTGGQGDIFLDANVEAAPSDTEPRSNPPSGSPSKAALRASGVGPLDLGSILALGLDEAKDRVFESMSRTHALILKKAQAFRAPTAQHKPGTISMQPKRSWLAYDEVFRQNQKLSKVLQGGKFAYDSCGLSLVPHSAAFRAPWSKSTDQLSETFCLYSTDECRKTCLVNTGQRTLEDGAFALSYMFSQALREDPEAFMRLMHAAAVQSFKMGSMNDARRFLRLNVLSDLPWELTAPGFVESICDEARSAAGIRRHRREDGFMCYDYSKVPYRSVDSKYYDLTFSFTGVENRLRQFKDTIDAGLKSAVVFVRREMDGGYTASPGKKLAKASKDQDYYPWSFFDMAVWNGDRTDIRALDPDGVQIVGLTYKVSRYKVAALAGSGKQFGLQPTVPMSKLDKVLPLFLVRVMQPDPEAPPVVVPTQDPALNRNLFVLE